MKTTLKRFSWRAAAFSLFGSNTVMTDSSRCEFQGSRRARPGALLGALGLMVMASPALADAMIVHASSPDVEVGRWLRDGDVIQVGQAVELTLLQNADGQLKIVDVPAGGFVYRDKAGEPDVGTMKVAAVVSSLLTSDEEMINQGASRGGKGARGRAGDAASCEMPSEDAGIKAVAELSNAGCDDEARGLLEALINKARQTD